MWGTVTPGSCKRQQPGAEGRSPFGADLTIVVGIGILSVKKQPLYPSLYQINTRAWLTELSRSLGRRATLDDIPDVAIDCIARWGFDWVWFLGVWQTGPAARVIAASVVATNEECKSLLSDLTDDDIVSSPFAVQKYSVNTAFGGDEALERLRARLAERGLRLMLDFVPNHTAPDNPWVREHPEYYVLASDEDADREPQNYTHVMTNTGPRVIAYGRDPYFAGWTDTFQLNYRSFKLRRAMIAELRQVAARCDGVRCDMAMLLLPDVIQRTWGDKSRPADGTPAVDAPFWPEAISRVRADHSEFTFMAEVYWDLEWTLQQQGFDYTYDKRLYDRLHAQDAVGARGHLHADPAFQKRSARFLENHDEPRAAAAFLPDVHQAAAVATFLIPGLRFFHEGEFEGRRKRLPMQLCRRPNEPIDATLRSFYDRLLVILRRSEVRDGTWQLLECRGAWEGNSTWERFIVGYWTGADDRRLLTVVNYGPTQGQCYVTLPGSDLAGQTWVLQDLLSPARYERFGTGLVSSGLYLDLGPWQAQVFEVVRKDG